MTRIYLAVASGDGEQFLEVEEDFTLVFQWLAQTGWGTFTVTDDVQDPRVAVNSRWVSEVRP